MDEIRHPTTKSDPRIAVTNGTTARTLASGKLAKRKPTKKDQYRYYELRQEGYNQREGYEAVGVSHGTANRWDTLWKFQGNPSYKKAKAGRPSETTTNANELSKDAKRALEDFEYFQLRYGGRISVGWQKEMAAIICEKEATPRDEYVCVNVAPGSGKSSTLVWIAIWMICRNRGIRILWGSFSEGQAEWYTNQIRTILTTKVLIKADPKEIAKGAAVDATGNLVEDFGNFKSIEADIWRKGQFYVEQEVGRNRVNKEATVQAFGMDSSFIGGRYDLVIWDDVYDPAKLRSWDLKERQREWWTSTAETRLDMGGLLVLQMQRLDPEDISHFALGLEEGEHDEGVWTDEDDEEDAGDVEETASLELVDDEVTTKKKYHHIVYPAHFDHLCKGPKYHRVGAPSYPDGCLLYEKNIPWRKIAQQKANNPKFRMLYQQEDIDPVNTLVDPLWIRGGIGPTGIEHPGCWDKDRGIAELPPYLPWHDCISMVTVDPSPSQMWAIQWWIWNSITKEFILMDIIKHRMEAPDFLDWVHQPGSGGYYTGVMYEWQERSLEMGARISHLVVEINAAQKFMLQYDHMQRFMRQYGVSLIPHTTNQNKNDDKLGLTILQPEFQYGRIRLPGAFDRGRRKCMWLYDEVTRYQLDLPDGGITTNDQVMSLWFARLAIQKIYRPKTALPTQARPSWVKDSRKFAVVA